MKNIIKAQLYQLKKERLLTIVFWGLFAVLLMDAFFGSGEGVTLSGSETAAKVLQFHSIISSLFVFMVTGICCCSDFLDKTANYEIMSGHTRKEVYLGRVIPCIIIGTTGWLILICSPYILCTAVAGWGTKLAFGDFLLRVVLMILPIIRIICEFIMLSFIIRNPYIIMGIGYGVFVLGGLSEAFSQTGSYFLGITNLTLLSGFDTWLTFGMNNGAENYIYESALPVNDIVCTIIFSVIFSAASLFLGYHFFKTDDVN